jgi:putative endonuclease
MPAWLYILRVKSGQLYIGSTTDLDQRYKDHCSGKACRTTQLDPPQKLLYSEKFASFSDARKREAQVKHWSRAKKEALVTSDVETLHQLAKRRKR